MDERSCQGFICEQHCVICLLGQLGVRQLCFDAPQKAALASALQNSLIAAGVCKAAMLQLLALLQVPCTTACPFGRHPGKSFVHVAVHLPVVMRCDGV